MHKEKSKNDKGYLFSFNNSLKNSCQATPESSKYPSFYKAMCPSSILSHPVSKLSTLNLTTDSTTRDILSSSTQLTIKRTRDVKKVVRSTEAKRNHFPKAKVKLQITSHLAKRCLNYKPVNNKKGQFLLKRVQIFCQTLSSILPRVYHSHARKVSGKWREETVAIKRRPNAVQNVKKVSKFLWGWSRKLAKN